MNMSGKCPVIDQGDLISRPGKCPATDQERLISVSGKCPDNYQYSPNLFYFNPNII